MKRTVALFLGLLFLLTLAPVSALADNDVNAYLDVDVPAGTQTLFQYGTDSFDWTNASLTVTLYDDTVTNVGGTALTLGTSISSGTYIILIDGTTYDNVSYAFDEGDIGSKTLTVKYTYTPTGHSNSITVTESVTISIQRNILSSLAATGPWQTDYYAGEVLNLNGLTVEASYTNMTDPVSLSSGDYTVKATDAIGTNEIASSEPLTTTQTKIIVTRSETYSGSDTTVSATAEIPISVGDAADELVLSDSTLDLLVGATTTVTATPKIATVPTSPACLVASVDKPAIAAIDTTALNTVGDIVITPLSVGTAVVTVRTRGSSISQTVVVNVTEPPTYVESIALDMTTLSLPVNGSYSLTATLGPSDATDKTVDWTSSSDSDVSVDSTGTVTVLRSFTTPVVITAEAIGNDPADPALTATCTVSANLIEVDGITLSDTSVTLYKGSWTTISAVVTPENAADPSVSWSSSNTAVATVDSTGKITAVGIPSGEDYGEAVITAQTSNSSVSAACSVKVLSSVLATSVTLSTSTLEMNVGDEETLTATVLPSSATNKTLTWTSDDESVATVSSSGKVIAASSGTAVIQAETTDGSGKYASCVVTVSNIQILNISLDKSALDLTDGDTATITATVYPTNATYQTLKWTSSNTSVATVDSKGNVVAGSTKGYSIIRAAALDGSGKYAECVVLSKPKISVTGITLNYGTTLTLLLSDSTYLTATILPSNATTQSVTWASSNTSIATISSSGLLTGVAAGQATITASADSKSVSITVTVTSSEYSYGTAANFKRRVNVRASASGLSKLVGYAYLGDTFAILGKTGNWYYIQYNNTTKGYIWAPYLNATKTTAGYTSAGSSTSSSSSTSTTTPTTVTITNCLYAVNVRSGPSTSYTRLGKAKLGATYTYLGVTGDWYEVQYTSSTVGYIYTSFVSLS